MIEAHGNFLSWLFTMLSCCFSHIVQWSCRLGHDDYYTQALTIWAFGTAGADGRSTGSAFSPVLACLAACISDSAIQVRRIRTMTAQLIFWLSLGPRIVWSKFPHMICLTVLLLWSWVVFFPCWHIDDCPRLGIDYYQLSVQMLKAISDVISFCVVRYVRMPGDSTGLTWEVYTL